jgi:predicted amidohydrolase YtcJ
VVVAPGFVDPHLHLLAMAAARLSVDLGGTRSVAEIERRLRAASLELAPGEWLRGSGYSLHELADPELLDRTALDRAVPVAAAVIHERSGHQAVCNTAALRLLGLDEPSGRIANGERRLGGVPPLAPERLEAAVAESSRELAAAGVTAVTDATHTNGPAELELLGGLVERGAIRQRLTAMVAVDELEAASAAGWAYGRERHGVVAGHAKAIAEDLGREGLREAVAESHRRGFPVAVHVLDVEPLEDALDAIEAAGPGPGPGDRIEHFSLSLPAQVERAAALGVTVVTQPGFLAARGGKYRAELSPPEQELLYRVGSLLAAGARVAASSDAPVTSPRPLATMAAAVGRGGLGSPGEAVSPAVALELVTSRAAAAGPGGGGDPAPGRSDLAVLDRDPTLAAEEPPRVLATVVGGEAIFLAGDDDAA